jgi:hypothetical protein
VDEQERPEDTVRRLAHRLVEIEKVHQPKTICNECGREWPCPTRRMLDENPGD